MPFFKNPKKMETEKLDVHEAYTIWRILVDRYASLDHLSHLKNYIHDNDFLIYLAKYLDDIREETGIIEKTMQKYSIVGPEQPPSETNKVTVKSEVIKDREIAEVMYRFSRLDVILMSLSLKFTPTNDKIWSLMIDMVKTSINRIDNMIKYFKLKNWLYEPPLYPHVPSDVTEKVAANEISLLWDHLIFRYHNIRQTQVFATLATDPDFIVILNLGVKILQKDIKALEDRLLFFGVTLPRHYTSIIPVVNDKTLLEDRYMLNTIMRGMREASATHATAIQEVVVNDKLRKFFIELTFSEIDYLRKFTQYGILKGWVFSTPVYK